jgi:hypothetical protein
MRACCYLLAALAVHALTGCAQIVPQADAATDTRAKFKKCMADNNATAEGKTLAPRLWMEDSSDAAEKLLDPNPLTPAEREAIVPFHTRAVQCRQIIITHASQRAAAGASFFQDYAKRSDAIFYKLANGQIPVGLANRLSIESDRKLLADLANGRANNISPEEAARQRSLEEMIEEGNRLAVSQAQTGAPAPTCTWLGTSLYCTNAR